MTTAHQILTNARKLIAAPSGWTRNAFARLSDGRETWAGDPKATCFCALGALARAGKDATFTARDDAEAALVLASRRLYDYRPEVVNDIRGHAQVLDVYDAAISDMETAS